MRLTRTFFSTAAGLLAASTIMLSASYAQEQEKTVKFALVAPISGPMAHDGQLMRLGAELAIEDVNAQGGIKALGGAKMELIVEDAGGTVETAKNAAQRLVADNPDVVAGTGAWSSSLTLAVTEVTERAGLPWLTLAYADKVTDRGFKYIIKTTPGAKELAKASIPAILDLAEHKTGKRPTKVALISDSTAAAQDFFKPLREGGSKELGLEVVVDEVFTPPLTDATTMVQQLRATKPDFMLFYPTGFPDIRLVLSKMSEFGLGGGKLPVVAIGAQFVSPEMVESLGADVMQGLIAVVANQPSKKLADVLPALTERSKRPWLGQDEVNTYGDVWLVKNAIERASSADHDAVMKALKETDTTEGPAKFYLGDRLAFDADGRRLGGVAGLVQWQDGKPYLVSPLAQAVREPVWQGK